ncbi:hypothetical protein N2152v2_001800 [Parachlorella kessleri]
MTADQVFELARVYLQADACQIAKCPNFWTARDDIEGGTCNTAAEEAVRHLYQTCLRGLLPENWAGAEWWVQSYDGGRGLAFHFDKDEHAMKARHEMITPVFSSVLYLTGSDGLRQSPTVIVNQRYNREEQYAYPDHPDHSTLVFPAANCYCLFDGGLGHGVLDCGHNEVRTTFLVNWWAQQPEAVQRVSEEDIVRFQLTRAGASSSLDSEELTAVEVACATSDDDDNEATSSRSSSSSRDGSRCCSFASGACCETGMEQGVAARVPLPSVTVCEQEVEVDGFLTLDDLLQDRGLALSGVGAVPGIALSHPGLVLFPLEGSQLRASAGEVQIGAALVPLSSLPEDSGCSSGSDEDEGEGVARLRSGEGSGAAAV